MGADSGEGVGILNGGSPKEAEDRCH